jgi:hypothetical protein
VRKGTRTTLVYSFWSAASGHPAKAAQRSDSAGLNPQVLALLQRSGAFSYRHRSKHRSDTNEQLVGSLGDHLVDVARTLVRWESPDYLVNAGLLHSAYGPLGFSQQFLNREDRKPARRAAGKLAERLAFLFAALERSSVRRTGDSDEILGALDDGRAIRVGRRDLADIDQLTWANLVAQSPGLPVTPLLQEAARRAVNRPTLPEVARNEITRWFLHGGS